MTDPALAPRHAVAIQSAEQFTPAWSGATASAEELALALYRFNVAGYSGATELRLNWYATQQSGDCFIGIPDFAADRWAFLPCPSDGVVPLTASQYLHAIVPGTQELLAVPIFSGSAPWILASIRIGQPVEITGFFHPNGDRSIFEPRYTGGGDETWLWSFGGATSPATYATRRAEVQLNTAGFFAAQVTATGSDGQQSTYPFCVQVAPHDNDDGPTISALTANGGETGQPLTLAAQYSGEAPLIWRWDFGGGASPNSSSDAQPSVVLGSPGIYSACVTATNNLESYAFHFKLNVTPSGAAPAPLLTSIDDGGGLFAGEEDTLVAQGSGLEGATFTWDFGGAAPGMTTTSPTARLTLQTNNYYRGSVIATNSSGSAALPLQFFVSVPFKPAIQSVSGTSVIAGLPLQVRVHGHFTPGTTFDWDFGGACAPQTHTGSQIMIAPLTPGTFSCHVTAANGAGTAQATFPLQVNAPRPPLPNVGPLTAHNDELITFSDGNFGDPATAWNWDFGGGCNPNTSTLHSPVVTTLSPGTYSGTLTASNAVGSTTQHFTLTIEYLPPGPAITSVDIQPSAVVTQNAVSFEALNPDGDVTSWSWDFGGGCSPNTSPYQFPVQTAGAPGTYQCSVTVTNSYRTLTYPFTLVVTP